MIEHNAVINRTFLGVDDSGIMTCMLHLGFSDSRQSYGGYCLDRWFLGKDPVGYPESITALRGILETVGVRQWKDLEGRFVRVRKESDSLSAKIIAIGHIIENRWFSFEDHFRNQEG